MLFRGGVDALLMRTQLAMPQMEFFVPIITMQIFTTHGVIMILFMAMPLMFGFVQYRRSAADRRARRRVSVLECTQLLDVFLRRDAVQPIVRHRRFAGCRLAGLSAAIGAVSIVRASDRISIYGAFRFPGSAAWRPGSTLSSRS